MVLITLAISKGSGESAHMRSLSQESSLFVQTVEDSDEELSQ